MSKSKKQANKKSEGMVIFFNILAVLLLVYMVYTIYTTYSSLAYSIEQNSTSFSEQWSYCVQAMLAAVVPCLVYAFTSYGIGIIIKNQYEIMNKD